MDGVFCSATKCDCCVHMSKWTDPKGQRLSFQNVSYQSKCENTLKVQTMPLQIENSIRTHVLDFSLGGCGGMAPYFNMGLTASCFSYCMTNTGRNYRFKSSHCRPQRGISRTDRSDLHMSALVCRKVGQAIKLWKVSNQIICTRWNTRSWITLLPTWACTAFYVGVCVEILGSAELYGHREPFARQYCDVCVCVCACVKHVKNGKHIKYCGILSIHHNLSGWSDPSHSCDWQEFMLDLFVEGRWRDFVQITPCFCPCKTCVLIQCSLQARSPIMWEGMAVSSSM